MLEKNLELYHSEILKVRQGLTANEAFNLKLKQRGFKGECDLYE